MNLQFIKDNDGVYNCEFKLNGESNIHIETNGTKPLVVLQRGISTGQYVVSDVLGVKGGSAFDFDINALVYPKWVKLSTVNEVTSATLTGDAEAV